MCSLAVPTAMLSSADMALGERATYATTLTVLGMLIIFAVLATVGFTIAIMRWFLNADVKRKAGKSPIVAEIDTDVQRDAVAAAPVAVTEDNGAVLAAITAAVAVVWESEHPGTGFRVVSYRHVDKFSAWNAKR